MAGPQLEPLLTLPNLLTLLRLPLAAALWLVPQRPAALLAIVAAAALSDVLDGWLARRRRARAAGGPGGAPGRRGAWLDPLCDKLFIASLLLVLYLARRPPLYMVALIATRDLLLVPLLAVYGALPALRRRLRLDLRAGPSGKAATLAQLAAAVALLAGSRLTLPLALLSAIVGLGAFAYYLARAARALRRPGMNR